MAKGAESKAYVENKIREAFDKDFVGVDLSTKKIYVNCQENGETVQVAISLTCPKTPFGVVENGMNFDSLTGTAQAPDVFQPVEITNEETERVKKMMEKFGL